MPDIVCVFFGTSQSNRETSTKVCKPCLTSYVDFSDHAGAIQIIFMKNSPDGYYIYFERELHKLVLQKKHGSDDEKGCALVERKCLRLRLAKIKFGHAQISVLKTGMPMSKTAFINPCKKNEYILYIENIYQFCPQFS